MSFIRPEAEAAIWRWREVLAGCGLLVLGSVWAVGSIGIFRWLALVICAAAVLLIAAGIQRGRFRGAGGGSGVVQVDERQITYFGPLSGGTIALAEIGAITLDHTGSPAHWLLVPLQGDPLRIPVNAQGSDTLFDAFSGLDGLKTERMLRALKEGETGQIVIWRRPDVQARAAQLH